MKRKIDIESLCKIPLFQGLKPETLKFLLTELKPRFFPDGMPISNEGEGANSMFIICSGQVAVHRNNEFLVTRGQNEIVGEQALIDETRRSATMYAQGTIELLELDQTTFDKIIAEDPQFSRNLLQQLSAKLRQATTDRGRRYTYETRLHRALREHISPQQIDELLSLDQYEDFLQPRHVEITVLFSDIRGFTAITESMDADMLASGLNSYYSSVIEIIYQHHGLIDKFIGDAVMTIFGLFHSNSDYTTRAVECGLKLIENAQNHLLGEKPIKIGVGIATGKVFYGHIGNEDKRQLTVLGDPINTASRLEKKTKKENIPILLDSKTAERVKTELPIRFIRRVSLRGKAHRIRIYTIDHKSFEIVSKKG